MLYFAATFFNSYRNYFYTLNTLPNPATRGNEIINVGDPAYRRLLRAFLDRCEVRPPMRPALGSDDVETDDSPFQILSRFGNAECILFGIANWGPHERHAVAFEADVPFEIRRLFVMDTVRETLKELPFRCEKGVLSTTLPQLDKSLVLIAMRNAGPLLAVASQPGEGKPVAVRVMNFLPEQAAGTLQLRVDGIPGTAVGTARVYALPGGGEMLRAGAGPRFRRRPAARQTRRTPAVVRLDHLRRRRPRLRPCPRQSGRAERSVTGKIRIFFHFALASGMVFS